MTALERERNDALTVLEELTASSAAKALHAQAERIAELEQEVDGG